jgi:hypothetical protein
MSNILDNGTVLPSFLTQAQAEDVSAFNKSYKSVQLKCGIIVDVFDVNHPKNLRKRTPEYNVHVIEQSENGAFTASLYLNCVAMDGIGGVADFFEFKRRAYTLKDPGRNADIDNQNGQTVLLLCMDGAAEKGVIIGGLKHAKRDTTLSTLNSMHMEGEYNGLNFSVDKLGALAITFNGPTDNNGDVINDAVAGSSINIEKDGSVEINTEYTDSSLPHESIRLDKTKESITIESRGDNNVKAGGNQSTDIVGNQSVLISGDFSQKSVGSADYTSSSLSVTSLSSIEVKGQSLDQKILGPCTTTAKSTDQKYLTSCNINALNFKVQSGPNELFDILVQLTTCLAQEQPQGFGAPLTYAAQYQLLMQKLTAMKGS